MIEEKSVEILRTEAWKLLEDKGLKMGERMKVRSVFASTYKDEHPYITRQYQNDKYYNSTHEEIKHMAFNSENEVVLANALYIIQGDNFNRNDFHVQFKMILRMLQIDSAWTE